MSDLVEFLLARVAEDEAMARRVQGRTRHEPPPTIGGIGDVGLVGYPYRRVLAECEAKRRIIALHEEWPVLIQTEPTAEAAPDLGTFAYRASQEIAWATNREYVARFGTEAPTTGVLRALALPYADHPDYREEWRP